MTTNQPPLTEAGVATLAKTPLAAEPFHLLQASNWLHYKSGRKALSLAEQYDLLEGGSFVPGKSEAAESLRARTFLGGSFPACDRLLSWMAVDEETWVIPAMTGGSKFLLGVLYVVRKMHKIGGAKKPHPLADLGPVPEHLSKERVRIQMHILQVYERGEQHAFSAYNLHDDEVEESCICAHEAAPDEVDGCIQWMMEQAKKHWSTHRNRAVELWTHHNVTRPLEEAKKHEQDKEEGAAPTS